MNAAFEPALRCCRVHVVCLVHVVILPAPAYRCLCLRICDELDVGCGSVTAFEVEVTKIHRDKMTESSGGETHEEPPLSEAEEAAWLQQFAVYPFVFVQSHDNGLFVDYVTHRDEPL